MEEKRPGCSTIAQPGIPGWLDTSSSCHTNPGDSMQFNCVPCHIRKDNPLMDKIIVHVPTITSWSLTMGNSIRRKYPSMPDVRPDA